MYVVIHEFLIFSRCKYIFHKEGKLANFPKDDQERLVKAVIEPMANDGLRTICLAYKDYVYSSPQSENQIQIDKEPEWEDEDNIISDLTCLCVVGIEDPVRPEVSFHTNFLYIYLLFCLSFILTNLFTIYHFMCIWL